MSAAHGALQQQVHTLYRDHHGWLLGWLRRRVGCPEHAADLTHDTFLRAFGSRELTELREPRAFLGTLGQRVLFSFWRRHELEQVYLDALAAQPEPLQASPEELMLAREALLQIDTQLDGLPTPVRQAFLLHRLDGLTQPEIAQELMLSLATIERHIRRAYLHCLSARLDA